MLRKSFPVMSGAASMHHKVKWARFSLSVDAAIANFQHVWIIPAAGTGVSAEVYLKVQNLQHAVLMPGAVIQDSVELRVNVAGRPPRMSNGLGPQPRFIFAPFAQAEKNGGRPAMRNASLIFL